MPKIIMIRISQKSLDINNLNELYSALEEEDVTIKRIFDPRFSHSGDDLVIEGDIDKVIAKLPQDLPKIIALKYQSIDFSSALESKSALNIEHGDTKIFFGTTLIDYEHLYDRLRIYDKTKILTMFFRSQLGGQLLPLMPVKIKGIVVTNNNAKTIDFILPSQRIDTIRTWLETLETNEEVDFDKLVNIFRNKDPNMRKRMEDAINSVNAQLPEIVAKSSVIENIDIIRAYQSSIDLL